MMFKKIHHPNFNLQQAVAPRLPRSRREAQHGATLIELLVGITIGLLTVAVALSTLIVSRGISGTVSENTQLQQQAAYAFRIIGQQMRQAGSIRLNLAYSKAAATTADPLDPVAFDTSFNRATDLIQGKDSPSATQYKLAVGYQNYTEPLFSGSTASQLRDCLGQQPSPTLIRSQFTLKKDAGALSGSLMCAGAETSSTNTPIPQPIIQNVADFDVSYLMQTNGATGAPQITKVNATTAAANWPSIFGVEVCLDLVANEIINLPTNSKYKNCAGTPTDMANRSHMVFRNTYQLRSQGSIN